VVSLTRRPCAPSDGPTSANQNSNPNLTITTVRRDGAAPPSASAATSRRRWAGPRPGVSWWRVFVQHTQVRPVVFGFLRRPQRQDRAEPPARRCSAWRLRARSLACWRRSAPRSSRQRRLYAALTLAIRGSAYVEVGDGGLVLLDPCRRRGPTTSRLYGSGSASQSRRSGAQVDSPRRVATTDRRARVLRRRLAGAVVSSMTGSATCELQCTAGFEPTELQRATKAKAARNLMIFLHWSSSPPPQMD
jgi:hypothetical protein